MQNTSGGRELPSKWTLLICGVCSDQLHTCTACLDLDRYYLTCFKCRRGCYCGAYPTAIREPTRMSRYSQRKVALGLCRDCGLKHNSKAVRAGYCLRHYEYMSKRRKKANSNVRKRYSTNLRRLSGELFQEPTISQRRSDDRLSEEDSIRQS